MLSEPVPVLVTSNMDIVDEVNTLEDDLVEARWAAPAFSPILCPAGAAHTAAHLVPGPRA